jgi:UDP-N-acetylmuramate--alanine ligase
MTVDLTSRRHVHFVGIGGIGMSALARHLLASGHVVSGSDPNPGEQGAALAGLGATVRAGHNAENLNGADLVVMTSAARDDNPELVEARARGVPVVKRAQLLGAILNPARGIAVAGTHGKTTTSALLGHVLLEAGLDPTILIGGVSVSLGSNARVGRSDLVVAEADEYDRSFLYLHPSIAVILNVEAEHLDIYGTEEGVRDGFATFASQVRDLLVTCADDPGAMAVTAQSQARTVTYGIEAGDWRAADICENGERMSFVVRRAHESVAVDSPLLGRHNVLNVLAAFAVARCLGVPGAVIARTVANFAGVGRRAEVVGEAAGVTVMDDYAHHPSEIRTVLSGLKARSRRPIRVIFQPHTYSRTRDFLADFARAFGDADHVYLLDIYAARETDTLGINGADLASEIERVHPSLTYIPDMQDAAAIVARDTRPGDLVVTMGAGDVYRLAPAVLGALS